jgi:hypothetical protein
MQKLNIEMAQCITTAILDRWRADSGKLEPARRLFPRIVVLPRRPRLYSAFHSTNLKSLA